MREYVPLSADDEQSVLTSPPETLGLALLRKLPDRPFRRSKFVDSVLERAAPRARSAQPGVTTIRSSTPSHDFPEHALRVAVALAWLEREGLVVQWPPNDPQYTQSGFADVFTVTPLGQRMRTEPLAAETIAARRRLGVDLHPALAARLREDIAVGAFETAALKALRAVEAKVRTLAGEPRSKKGDRLVGVALMQHAFSSPDGPLTDPNSEPGEQVGTMSLFAGAFGAVRNLVAHTEVEWADPVEAAEYVLLADLLMRIVARAEARLSPS